LIVNLTDKITYHQKQVKVILSQTVHVSNCVTQLVRKISMHLCISIWVTNSSLFRYIFMFYGLSVIHLRSQIEYFPPKAKGCRVQVVFEIEWLKSTKNNKRIKKNLYRIFRNVLKWLLVLLRRSFYLDRKWDINIHGS
jgi:hypothetical protein